MKANEFVKKYGICYAKKFDFSIWRKHKDEIDFDEDNLIRLIEAHELVESYGGLDDAKDEYHSRIQNKECVNGLSSAIDLVESCQ